MLHIDLLKTAEKLYSSSNGKPKQADLRRAMSTVYYALFHCLTLHCANSFIGRSSNRGKSAWQQVYRSLNHNTAKTVCNQISKNQYRNFPPSIINYANNFCQTQEKRHLADYDPYAKFKRSEVKMSINSAKSAIDSLDKENIRHRKAFTALLLFGNPRKN